MARRGRGRRRGGQGFSNPRQPDQFNGRGRVRTARGGTRNRGGGLVAPTRARGSAARGTGLAAPRRVINVGGGSTRGGTGGLVKVSSDPYRKSSALVRRSEAGARDRGRSSRRRTRSTQNAGGRGSRRASAIRELARRGATQGERNAAAAAAARLGIRI